MSFSRNRFITLFLSGLIAIVFLLQIANAADAKKIVKNIQKKYKVKNAMRIDFVQKNSHSLTGTTTEISGTWIMDNKDKYRLDSEDMVLVSDGKTLWKYNKLNAQVLIDHAKKSEQDVMFNNFFENIQDHYSAQIVKEEKVNKSKKYSLLLIPKPSQKSFFGSVKLFVTDKTWEISRLVFVDLNKNETEYLIEKIEFAPNVSEKTFSFTTPEGIREIDLRF